MLAKTFASAVQGINAKTIIVEVNSGGTVTTGQKMYDMVGLPDNAVKEGFQRIEAAIKNIDYKMLRVKTIINLAPANIKKQGSAYDLPIAIGVLAASRQVQVKNLGDFVIMGELSLDGNVRPINGTLPIAIQARKEKFKGLVVPLQNAKEAAIVNDIEVYGVSTLTEAVEFLSGNLIIDATTVDTREMFKDEIDYFSVDFNEVKGQENIKRALEIAAAGGHNAILIGPPGAGKTMLAKRLPGILPPLSLQEALEVTKIHSVAGLLGPNASLISSRPFRCPHHTISDVALF